MTDRKETISAACDRIRSLLQEIEERSNSGKLDFVRPSTTANLRRLVRRLTRVVELAGPTDPPKVNPC